MVLKKSTSGDLRSQRAVAVSKSKSLLVATKYQQAFTEEQFSIFKKELDRLVETKGGKSKGKPKKHTKTNAMQVDVRKNTQSA